MRTLVRAAAVMVVLAAAQAVVPTAWASTSDALACHVAAHRGDHTTATENGMGAFRQAVLDGAEWLEADAQVTADQHLVLMHDPTVDRTTNGTGAVAAKTGAQVRRLLLDDGRYRPPYVSQLLDLARTRNLHVLLELKSMGNSTSYRNLAARIRTAGVARVTVQSASASRLSRIKALVPRLRTAIISWTALPASTVRADGGIVVEQSVVTPEYLATLAGLPVYVFTVDSPVAWARLSRTVDAIITNDPAGYVAARVSLCAA
jgi:glycerophosphoryl diester phosphodiesterase